MSVGFNSTSLINGSDEMPGCESLPYMYVIMNIKNILTTRINDPIVLHRLEPTVRGFIERVFKAVQVSNVQSYPFNR